MTACPGRLTAPRSSTFASFLLSEVPGSSYSPSVFSHHHPHMLCMCTHPYKAAEPSLPPYYVPRVDHSVCTCSLHRCLHLHSSFKAKGGILFSMPPLAWYKTPQGPLHSCGVPKAGSDSLLYPAALQSPIEYQRKERSTAVMRSQPARAPQASPRPYSSGSVGSEKLPKGSSYNPPLPPLKISTSNGSPGFDYHQPGDKFEGSNKVSADRLHPPT